MCISKISHFLFLERICLSSFEQNGFLQIWTKFDEKLISISARNDEVDSVDAGQ
jgi:hypothetical protein